MISANSLLIRMLENMKRRIGIVAITGLVFFLSYPVRLLVSLSKYTGSQYNLSEGELAWEQLQSANSILGYSFYTLFLFAVLAVLIALTGFSYLHKRNKVDFYHSMPVSATKRFFTIFINCVLIFVICGLVNLLLSYGICAAFDVFSTELVAMSMKSFFIGTLFAVGIMAITTLATILTGKGLISFFGALILGGYEILIYVLVNTRVDRFFESLVLDLDGSGGALEPKTSLVWSCVEWFSRKVLAVEEAFSGLSQYEAARLKAASEGIADPAVDGMTGVLVLMAVMTVVTLALAWICYVKRPGEAAGKTMSFERTKRPIKIAVMIPGTMLMCDLIAAVTGADSKSLFANGNLSLLISMLFVSVIGCMIFEVIYEIDIKAIKKRLLDIVIVFAAVLGIQLLLQYDVFGIDIYQPKAEKVESIGVVDTQLHTAYGYYAPELNDGYYSQEYYYVTQCRAAMNSDPELKEEALRLVEAANERIRKRKSDHAQDIWEEQEYVIYVAFQLTDGEECIRKYRLPASELMTIRNLLIQNEETRSVLLQAFCGSYQSAVFEDGTAQLIDRSQYSSTVADTPDAMSELREAYLKDMDEFTVQEGETAVLVGMLKLECPSQTIRGLTELSSTELAEPAVEDPWMNAWEYPIYDTFTHTLAYLSSVGEDPADYLKEKKLRSVTILSVEEDETLEISLEDTEMIETLIKSAGSDYIQDPYKNSQQWDYGGGTLCVEWTSTEHPDSKDYFTFRTDCSTEVEKLLSGLH